MSVVDIKELRRQFEAKTAANDLQEFAVTQQHLIEKLLLENKKQQEKITHLEHVLQGITTSPIVGPVSKEELICIEQISILHKRSTERELTLDDVKRLDLLVKNLRSIREMATTASDSGSYRDVEEAELVQLAQQTDSE